MTPPRSKHEQDPLDPSDPEMADLLRELSGEPRSGETRVAFSLDEVADVDEDDDSLTGIERERGYLEVGIDPTGGVRPVDELSVEALVDAELASDETSDPDIASQEGVPWVPPVDPVMGPDEPYDADHHSTLLPADDEMTARVREALRADAMTTTYADRLTIDTEGDVVTLSGTVEDIEDLEAVLAVAAVVGGVTEVQDELEVATL